MSAELSPAQRAVARNSLRSIFSSACTSGGCRGFPVPNRRTGVLTFEMSKPAERNFALSLRINSLRRWHLKWNLRQGSHLKCDPSGFEIRKFLDRPRLNSEPAEHQGYFRRMFDRLRNFAPADFNDKNGDVRRLVRMDVSGRSIA